MKKTISELLSRQEYDIVHLGHPALLPLIPKKIAAPIILQQESINSTNLLLAIGFSQTDAAHAAFRFRHQLELFLKACWERASVILTNSESKRDTIYSQLPKANIFVLPPGVDINYYNSPFGDHDNKTMTIPIRARAQEDVKAARDFIKQVWPNLQRRDDDLRIFIVSQSRLSEIQMLNNYRNVFVIGDIPDVRPFITGSTMALFPQQQAEGISAEALKTMALARPIIATRNAVNGIRAVNGEHLLLAESPGEFSARISELINNKEKRKKLGINARLFVAANHRWEQIAGEIDAAYQSVSANKFGGEEIGEVHSTIRQANNQQGRNDDLAQTVEKTGSV